MLRFSGSNTPSSSRSSERGRRSWPDLVIVQHRVQILDPDETTGPSRMIQVFFFSPSPPAPQHRECRPSSRPSRRPATRTSAPGWPWGSSSRSAFAGPGAEAFEPGRWPLPPAGPTSTIPRSLVRLVQLHALRQGQVQLQAVLARHPRGFNLREHRFFKRDGEDVLHERLEQRTSSATNLDMFMSRSVRIMSGISTYQTRRLGVALDHPMRSTLRMFRRPVEALVAELLLAQTVEHEEFFLMISLSVYPHAASFTVLMIWRFGTIIVTPRTGLEVLRSSWRLAYPGFIVMKNPTRGSRLTALGRVKMNSFRLRIALSTQNTCCAHTESTSRLMRLNSSKHPHKRLREFAVDLAHALVVHLVRAVEHDDELPERVPQILRRSSCPSPCPAGAPPRNIPSAATA